MIYKGVLMNFKILMTCIFFMQSIHSIDNNLTTTLKLPKILDRHIQRHIKKMQKQQVRSDNIVHVYSTSSPKSHPRILSKVIFLDN